MSSSGASTRWDIHDSFLPILSPDWILGIRTAVVGRDRRNIKRVTTAVANRKNRNRVAHDAGYLKSIHGSLNPPAHQLGSTYKSPQLSEGDIVDA